MFFPRLRNQAKWAFVFLILVFGGGFIFLGVGSGGLDLGQLLSDAFGNRILLFYISEAPSEITFEVTLTVERAGYPDLLPRLAADQATQYLAETMLTAADERIAEAAQELATQHREPLALAAAINAWVGQAMRYGWGVTHVGTTAAEADSPTSTRPPGSSQDQSSVRRTSRTWPMPLRTIANATGNRPRA